MAKDTFILYTEQKEVIDKLSDEQAGKLIKAIYEYVETGEMPKLDSVLDLVIIPFKQNLDRNADKYEETKKKRSEAGKLGAEIKKQKQAKQANAKFANNKQANQAVNVNDNVNVNVNEDLLLEKENKEKEEKLQQRFIECLNSFNENAISECIAYLDKLPFEVIEYVLKKTSGISNPNWNYADTILEDYYKKGINTIEKVRAEENKYKNKTAKKETTKTSFEGRQYAKGELSKLYANLGGTKQ